MFVRTSLTSRSMAIGAVALGAGIATYRATRSAPMKLDTAFKPGAGVSTQVIPEMKSAPKRTFTSAFYSVELEVAQVEQISHDTKKITFQLPTKEEVCGLKPSAAILTQHTPKNGWLPVFRPYTPINDLDEPGTLQLLVKKYPNGKASSHMHSLTPGSKLSVRGPLPGYSYKPSTTPRNLLLIAGGAGITPIYSLTKGIIYNPDDKTKVQLVWGVNGTRDIILRNELEELEKRYPERLQVTYAVSGPEAKADANLGDDVKWKKGYVDQHILGDIVQRCKEGVWGDEKGTKVFLCGPPGMEESLAGKKSFFGSRSGALDQLGIEKRTIYRF